MPRKISKKNYTSRKEKEITQAVCLDAIYKAVSIEGLSDEVMKRLCNEIHVVQRHFGIGPYAAVLLAAILEKSYSNHCLDDEDLARYFGCSNIEFIQHHADIREMVLAGVAQEFKNNNRRWYRITQEAVKSIEKETEFTPVKMSDLTPAEFFERMRDSFMRFRNDDTDVNDLLCELESLIQNNSHLDFCKKVMGTPLMTQYRETERRMFLYMCHHYVISGDSTVEINSLLCLIDMCESGDNIRRAIANGRSNLQCSDMVCFPTEDGLADTESLMLSDKVRTEFFEGVEIALPKASYHSDVVPCANIRPKELFYNEKELSQIERLAELLEPGNFRHVQERLQDMGMRKGFNALFYGGPGTGKTACVYELARRTGRDVFCVDMSKLRNKYVGESEKSVKAVFQIYRRLCRGDGLAPILLFNEADAVFARRFDNVVDSVDQMNNTIQNIILQEMENLDGILIATTNLATNLDAAFERRFIFKVEFNLPERESRTKIWRSMLPDLSDADVDVLAGSYEFSGGNIENIARKSSVEYVLSGNRPDLAMLRRFCDEETLQKGQRKKIGFQQ